MVQTIKDIFSGIKKPMTLKLGIQHLVLKCCQVYQMIKIMDLSETVVVYDTRALLSLRVIRRSLHIHKLHKYKSHSYNELKQRFKFAKLWKY